MNTVITVYSRTVYGRTLVYALNPEQARLLTLLTNAKTLEHRHLQGLEGLGFVINHVADPAERSLSSVR